MPDGRPLFAWRNEIEMLRAEAKHIEEERKRVKEWAAILGVVEIEQERELHSGDYLIRVHLLDLINSSNVNDALKHAEITRKLTTTTDKQTEV